MHAKSLEFIRKNLKLHEKIADFEIELRRKVERKYKYFKLSLINF